MNRIERLCRSILRRRYPLVLIGLGLLLTSPSLWVGLQFDDFGIRAAALNLPSWGRMAQSPWEPFSFLDGIAEHNRVLMDRGVLPWWSDPHCRLSFFRPLTALTHIVDYRLWGNQPWLMHVQSLAWFAMLIWAAATLYRRLLGRSEASWTAVLAALLFTLDDAHGNPVGWLANRNAILAGVFGILALIAHDRWRRDGRRSGMLLAPLALLAGLLSKESAVCTLAYLAGYAIFLDGGRWYRRLATLVPCLVIGLVWYLAYRMLGYGASGSAGYVDPAGDPIGFLQHLVVNGPILLLGQWGLPASDLSVGLSASALAVHWLAAVVFLGILATLLYPLLRRDAVARFWTFGMLLSLLPAAVPFPGDRLLMFVGLGAMGLLAQWLAAWHQRASWLPKWSAWRPVATVVAYLLIVIHLIFAPLMLPVSAGMAGLLGRRFDRFVQTLPRDEQLARQTAIFVNAGWFANVVATEMAQFHGRPIPARLLCLSGACPKTTLKRTDATTLVVRPQHGYLPLRDWSPGPGQPAGTCALGNMLRVLDLLVRSDKAPLALGETVTLSAVTIEITALTEDGRPAEATFRFHVPLEDPALRWLIVTPNGYAPFPLPGIGETATVPSPFRTSPTRSQHDLGS